jgi:hypothetical protein
MTQQEIYDFLSKHPNRCYCVKEIAKINKWSIGSVTIGIKKLYARKFIRRKIKWIMKKTITNKNYRKKFYYYQIKKEK